ncbi:MAG: hypothetical protein IJR14_01930 [Synergistaceae bacterium]|nr:hypothetical protein [Synergistaceae bacterium]
MPDQHKVMTEEEFFKEFEKPVVLSRIVGFAGIDPAPKGSGPSGGGGGQP